MSARQWIRKLLSLDEPEAQEAWDASEQARPAQGAWGASERERPAQGAWGASEQAAEITRQAERVAWVRETSAALREAWRERDDSCTEAVERLSEKEFDLLFEAEEAKVEMIFAQLRAVADHDRWPRHLHWSL